MAPFFRASGVVLALSSAPLQCPARNPPELAHEDTPGDALWGLAERFAQQGNSPARRATLTYLVDRYPSSRWAPAARDILAQP